MNLFNTPEMRKAVYEVTYDIIVAHGLTPHIRAYCYHDDYIGPVEYAGEDGLCIFNLTEQSLGYYAVTEKGIEFDTRFQGVHTELFVPWGAVINIFAKEEPATFNVGFALVPEGGTEEVKAPDKKELTNIKLVSSVDNPKVYGPKKTFKPKIVK